MTDPDETYHKNDETRSGRLPKNDPDSDRRSGRDRRKHFDRRSGLNRRRSPDRRSSSEKKK